MAIAVFIAITRLKWGENNYEQNKKSLRRLSNEKESNDFISNAAIRSICMWL